MKVNSNPHVVAYPVAKVPSHNERELAKDHKQKYIADVSVIAVNP